MLATRLGQVKRSRKWVTAALLPEINRRRATLFAVLVLVTGLLPVCIVVVTAVVVGSIPGALGEGFDSGAGRRAVLALGILGVLFVVLQAAGAVLTAVASALGWDLNRYLEQRVMGAVASPPGLRHLEDPSTLDRIGAARDVVVGGYRPCDALPAMAARTSAWLQGGAAAIVLATYQWWLGALLFGAWVWKGRVLKRAHLQGATVIGVKSSAVRRSEYLRDLALTPPAAKELRVFGLTEWLLGRFRAETTAVLEQARVERAGDRRLQVTATWAALAASLAAYLVLGVSAARGHLDLHDLALYTGAVTAIQLVVHVGLDNLMLERGTEPVVAVSTLGASIGASAGAVMVPPTEAPQAEVRFEDVTFRYPGAIGEAVSHLDLTLPAGRSVAIVGANGAGKTTLVKLLCRFYEPDSGHISVDGHDLAQFDACAWQRHVAAVFQDFARYPVSAADNISFGGVEHAGDRTRVEEAARRAGALDALEALPHGLDTVLAPHHAGGTDLSGGQWQRVVLARALFAADAGARILVLDEPAANLDARGEAELYDRFLDITGGVTTLVISHRFSTVRRADLIYVLEHGRMAEQGTHDQLMDADGLYARMFRLQASRLTGTPAEGHAGDA